LAIIDLLLPLASLSCEWSWKNRSTPDVLGVDASITIQSGSKFPCIVKYFYLLEPSFTLSCANGSQVLLGSSPMCGDSSFPACDYSIVTDRKGQQFKMSESLASGWDKAECEKGIATSVMDYRLSQEAFSFDARITIRVKAAKKITPSGF
jgi:hypothetical protein